MYGKISKSKVNLIQILIIHVNFFPQKLIVKKYKNCLKLLFESCF